MSTVVFEAHGQPGGCAGFFSRRGFSFDVGATTLVDFEEGGVGAELLAAIGIDGVQGEALSGYMAWLPDRTLTLFRDQKAWHVERLKLGATPAHRAFWNDLDWIADVFWRASRRGVRLPITDLGHLFASIRAVGPRGVWGSRYLSWTVMDLLRKHGIEGDRPLVSLLSMLIEDTVHSTVAEAPLINSALGVTIRAAGLTRPTGGMKGFWKSFVARYAQIGGILRRGSKVENIERNRNTYVVRTRRENVEAAQLVVAVPPQVAALLGPVEVSEKLRSYIDRENRVLGSAVVVFLGVPEHEVAGHEVTHHQLLQSYEEPLGNGNNMFVSVSASGDIESAPLNHRAVMISTHCSVDEWNGLSPGDYIKRKEALGERLITYARRVYPRLGTTPEVREIATPKTYERFVSRPMGAVGGTRLHHGNSNQRAIPHDIGVDGYWLAGDWTWPGLGTVAASLASKIVSGDILRYRR